MIFQIWFVVVFWGEVREGQMSQTGKLKVWVICEKRSGCQDKHLRCNASLLPAGGSREPTGVPLTEAWVASSGNAIVVAAWVVLVLQMR